MKSALFILMLSMTFLGCNTETENNNTAETQSDIVTTVMSKEDQNAMSPDEILSDLMAGNERYVASEMLSRDLPAQIKASTSGQSPKAVILACIDSRVPVEAIFDQGIGDVFVARVAGNIENPENLGSMEYGIGVAGSKLLMVLGHQNCGAVKSAIDQVDVGSDNVTALLNEIQPAVEQIDHERDSGNKSYLKDVVTNNVVKTVADIRERSGIISSMESEGKVKVVGAYYSLADGAVTILD